MNYNRYIYYCLELFQQQFQFNRQISWSPGSNKLTEPLQGVTFTRNFFQPTAALNFKFILKLELKSDRVLKGYPFFLPRCNNTQILWLILGNTVGQPIIPRACRKPENQQNAVRYNFQFPFCQEEVSPRTWRRNINHDIYPRLITVSNNGFFASLVVALAMVLQLISSQLGRNPSPDSNIHTGE